MIHPLIYFWLLLRASLITTGGSGNLPILHQDLLALGWATDRQFAEALAIGQISPGPTGLWVICLGYLTYGLPGSLMALVAITLPPLTVLAVDRLYRRIGDHPAVQGFVHGLSLAVAGIFLVVIAGLLRNNGVDGRSLVIVLVSLGLGLTRRVPVILIILLAALAGILLY
ncbi:MAG: chromate transporter [Herpetosiphonaceae bacterium]|nr:chromate transporter [Herpetosiphonaceae bacterium]